SMTDESNVEIRDSDAFKRQRSKEEMQKQLISFALMIVFTLIAFALVATESINKMYVVPILFIMAIVQAGFQFYYFIEFKEKNHVIPATLIFGGVLAACLTLACLVVISWW